MPLFILLFVLGVVLELSVVALCDIFLLDVFNYVTCSAFYLNGVILLTTKRFRITCDEVILGSFRFQDLASNSRS